MTAVMQDPTSTFDTQQAASTALMNATLAANDAVRAWNAAGSV
jgi:hypothetical protein